MAVHSLLADTAAHPAFLNQGRIEHPEVNLSLTPAPGAPNVQSRFGQDGIHGRPLSTALPRNISVLVTPHGL
jgi:hypothetical protein|tara:strand:+ start:7885 stop:8100 length:216 start_codon:yes stop_codon:yes gene_type:complete